MNATTGIPAKHVMTKEYFLREMNTVLTDEEKEKLSLLYDLGASVNDTKMALIGERNYLKKSKQD